MVTSSKMLPTLLAGGCCGSAAANHGLPAPFTRVLPPPSPLNHAQPADQVFTFERWNKHRNPQRYAKHLLHMFTSRVFK